MGKNGRKVTKKGFLAVLLLYNEIKNISLWDFIFIFSWQKFCRDFLIYIFLGSFQINLNFEYNLLHLLHNVRKGSTVIAVYEYSYGGVKLKVWGSDGNGYAYVGSLVYRVRGRSSVFECGLFSEGVVSGSGICYPLKDHLGSIRAIINGNGRLLEENDYYAFGHRHPRSEQAQSSANRFKYNGKELQTVGGLGYLDYGARLYDQSLGRWFTTDPLSEKYYGLSPYVYCGNNPLNMIDLDGRVWRLTFDEDHEGNRKYNGYEWISEETTTFDAMTNSSDPDVFATVPEDLYQAKVGNTQRK